MTEWSTHHIGWAVPDLEEATRALMAAGYSPDPNLPDCVDPQFKVSLRFLRRAGETLIELIAPTAADSAVGRILVRSGAGPYHVAYRIADFAAAESQLRMRGFRPAGPRTCAPGLGGRDIGFWHHPSLGLIELILWP